MKQRIPRKLKKRIKKIFCQSKPGWAWGMSYQPLVVWRMVAHAIWVTR